MTAPAARRLFVAGATGATGRALVRLADARGLDVVPHARPRHAAAPGLHPRAALFELDDAAALDAALSGCTTLLQLVGTMRDRFGRGDTYASSDVGTTARLVEAARRVGSVDHLVLLGSVGAGRPVGAYLQAKADAEALVRGAAIPFTILRPSFLVGEGRRAPPGAGLVTRLPGLRRFRPITIEALAALLVDVAVARAPLGAVLEGDALWGLVRHHAP